MVKKKVVALPSSLARMSFHNFEGFEKKKRVWKTRSRAEYFREYRQKKKEIETKKEVKIRIIWRPFLSNVRESISALSRMLYEVKSSTFYRFLCEWSFQMGWTSNRSTTMKGFETAHPIQQEPVFASRGINKTHPLEKSNVLIWQAELFVLASKIFSYLIPEFVSKQFVIHFSKMSRSTHIVKLHWDSSDISHQYALHLGEWTGAKLVCYDDCYKPIFESNGSGRILRFDGRLPHEVVLDNFYGVRFSIICFQLWREDKTKSDDIIYEPNYIY